MKLRDYALFFLNGERIEIRGNSVAQMLSDFLRLDKGLTGTKVVCAEGDCGACTVLRKFCGAGVKTPYQPINSCITTLGQMDGSSLISVEYLSRNGLDAIQSTMAACHASQCGYCTPGFVMALKGLVDKKREADPKTQRLEEKETKNALTGNLCRCTGYQQIIEAAVSIPLGKVEALSKELWLPKAEKTLRQETSLPLLIETESYSFYSPTEIKDAAKYLAKGKGARVIGAGTDLGVLVNKGKAHFPQLLSLHLLPELYETRKTGSKKEGFRLQVGARVTLESLRQVLAKEFPQFCSYLDIFASPQIKNVATLVGNIANASPIGDTLPLLLAMNARVKALSPKKERWIEMKDFYVGYRLTTLKKDEIIVSVEFDLPSERESLYLFKTSQRKDLDISAVNGAIRLSKDFSRVAWGGLAATPFRLTKLESLIQENRLSPDLIQRATDLLQKEIHPLSDLRGSQGLRRLVAEHFLRDSLQRYRKEASC